MAEFAGEIQAHVLIGYFSLWIASLLAGPYGPRATVVIEWLPIAILRMLIFAFVSALTIYVMMKTVADGILMFWLNL